MGDRVPLHFIVKRSDLAVADEVLGGFRLMEEGEKWAHVCMDEVHSRGRKYMDLLLQRGVMFCAWHPAGGEYNAARYYGLPQHPTHQLFAHDCGQGEEEEPEGYVLTDLTLRALINAQAFRDIYNSVQAEIEGKRDP